MNVLARVAWVLAGCLLAILSVGCQGLAVGEQTDTKIEKEWRIGAVGIAGRYGGGWWSYRSAEAGEGILVRLYEYHHVRGSFDGTSYSEIAIQLPADAREGSRFKLQALPSGGSDQRAVMKVGQIAAMQFGNPRWGLLGAADDAELRVISIGDAEVVIHLKLKANLEPMFSFDIDEQIRLSVAHGG